MMQRLIVIAVFILSSYQDIVVAENATGKHFVYNTYKYDTVINVLVNKTTEQILDFYEDSDLYRGFPSRVHVSSNDTINGEYPVFVTATQQKGVSSWEIPLVVQTSQVVMQFNDMARTLCPHDAGPNITSENRPTLQITTSNPRNVSVDIKLRRVQDFYVELEKEIDLTVTPSTPKYYYFSFDHDPLNVTKGKLLLPRFNYTIPKSVVLIIESDDDVCAVVSIQNNSCPVFDNEENVLYQGYHLTMTTKGGITLTQSMFPVGFYIVFIVKQSDEECTGVSETATKGLDIDQWMAQGMDTDGRVKNFRFRVIATISYSEYITGAAIMLALIAIVAMLALLVYIPACRCSETIVETVVEEIVAPSTSGAPDVDTQPIMDDRSRDDSDPEPDLTNSMPKALTLADLSRAPSHMQNRRSNRYFWSILTVAVVYALPVVQLLSTYQRMVFQTGNQDLCYYNFLCAHPLGFLSDSNHVFSNAAYIILGLVFMLQVRARQLATVNTQEVGIPQHHGLFYSMGLALVMEGILSACYHLCPNKMNFQFDSSFMYVIAVLCMVKLYQNRHPDVNASAHSTFMLLAFIMAIGVYGIMYPSIYFWITFTIAHLVACFVLTLKIYYVGRFRLGLSMPSRAYSALRQHGRHTFVPTYPARAVLLAIANLANWAIAAYGLYEHNKDFARHLLAILMGNTIIYILFYVCMKVIHREKILPHTWLYLALANAAWFTALSFFLQSNTKWSETPAHSRRHNHECLALQLLDSHDIWHFTSATALYLSFNMLFTVDSALYNTRRDRIPVF